MRQSRNILSGYLDDGDMRMRKEELCNLVKKIIVFLFSVLVLSVLVFFIARLAPGDPLVSYYGDRVEKMNPMSAPGRWKSLGLTNRSPCSM